MRPHGDTHTQTHTLRHIHRHFLPPPPSPILTLTLFLVLYRWVSKQIDSERRLETWEGFRWGLQVGNYWRHLIKTAERCTEERTEQRNEGIKTKKEKRGELITFCRARKGALFGSEQRRNRRMVRLWSRGVEEAGEEGESRAKDKEVGERAEKKRKGEGGGCRRQVLISNRLLVMRSLSHCSQIDVMWSSVVHRAACRGWQACMTSSPGHTHKHTSIHAKTRSRLTLILRLANAHKPINTGTKKNPPKKYTCTRHKEPLIHHNSLLLIFFKQEKELTQI